MTDIVEELENTWVGSGSGTILHDAKIEILRLRKDNKKIKLLEKALNESIAEHDKVVGILDWIEGYDSELVVFAKGQVT